MNSFVFEKLACIFVAGLLLSGCAGTKSLTKDELETATQDILDTLTPVATSPLSLEAAMIQAVRANGDIRAKALEAAIAAGDQSLANFAMMPQLTVQAGYNNRSNQLASVSRSVATGQISLVPSTSSDQESKTGSLELSWNLLDFGLAWLDSKAKSDQRYMALEDLRRVQQLVIRDVIYAWDRAMAYKAIESDVIDIQAKLQSALERSNAVTESGLRDPLTVIEYRKSLLLMVKRLNHLLMQSRQAKAELAQLLGLPVVNLPEPNDEDPVSWIPVTTLGAWQKVALMQRPEVRQSLYQRRIAELGGVDALLKTLPMASARYGVFYDGNSYLVNNDWQNLGAQVSWDLMQLASYPTRRKQAVLGKEIAEVQATLQVVAVLSQVAIAADSYNTVGRAHCLSEALLAVDDRRMQLLNAQVMGNALDRLSFIEKQVENMLLRVERDIDLAESRRAEITLLVSAGVDLLPAHVSSEPTEAESQVKSWFEEGLAGAISEQLSGYETSASDSVTLRPVSCT